MNAIVLGNGRSGKAAAELLRRDGNRVCVLDGKDVWPEGNWELCVTSPGIPLDHPWQAAARAAGVRTVSELQIGVEHFRAMGGRMLAVTGSKGKSSVVKLVADALNGVPCGNYGLPLCEVVLQCLDAGGRLPFAVVEVSSLQMETTELPPDSFEAAAILNLQEDHLDRHGSTEAYHALKLHLLDFASVGIVGTDPLKPGMEFVINDKKRQIAGLFEGSYFDNPVLRGNGECAVALMRAAGLGDETIKAAFARFDALPHRMQTVGVFGGVTYIDDSKATSIAALIAGVKMAISRFGQKTSDIFLFSSKPAPEFQGSVPRVRLIAGGQPKGDDPSLARGCLADGVAKAYLIGQCAQAFAEAWHGAVSCEMCGTLESAVAAARRDAAKGDCILLSPGTASFDQFKSYGERGERFAALSSQTDGREN
jgi:UDP-N-acetylmuramoylalanine--D-glutamate ligase